MRQLIVSIIVLVLVLYSSISAQAATEADGRTQGAPEYYFWNEVTGDVQWEDPGGTCCSHKLLQSTTYAHYNVQCFIMRQTLSGLGCADVPYETSSGSLYWVAEDGTVRDQDEKVFLPCTIFTGLPKACLVFVMTNPSPRWGIPALFAKYQCFCVLVVIHLLPCACSMAQ